MAGERDDSDQTANCILHVGDDQYKLTVKLNKRLLAAKSRVFEKMFEGRFPEDDVVEIKDVSPEAFIIILKYLQGETYCFCFKELAVDVLHAAEKYELLELKQKCEDFLLPKKTADVWWVAPYAYRYNSAVLQGAIRDLLSNYTSGFVFNEHFLDANEELVQLDVVANIQELEIFKAIFDWAEHQLKKEGLTSYDGKKLHQKLQNIIKFVRFDELSSQNEPALSQFMKKKEVKEILELCSGKREISESEEKHSIIVPVESENTTNKSPRKQAAPVSNVSGEKLAVEVITRRLGNVSLCYRRRKLQESVSVVQKADLVSVILPSMLASPGSQTTHYWENIYVSVKCSGYIPSNRSYCQCKVYGSGFFEGLVNYSQEIRIPITGSSDISSFTVSNQYTLVYYLTIYFRSQGLYPWQSTCNIPASSILGNVSAGTEGCVLGYKFKIC